VALGTENFGLWLIDATQGNQPQVVDVHNPVSGLSVHSLARGSQFLYVGWTDHAFESRLESLNTNNLANPVVAYATGPGEGSGEPGDFHGLRFVSGPTGKFLVGTRAELGILSTDTDLIVFDINSPLGEAALHRIYGFNLPYAGSSIATSANGSSVLVSADTAGLYRIVMPQSWAPGFSAPAPGTTESVCLGGSAAFSVSASGGPVGSEITYQWFRSGSPSVALTNGPTPWNTVIGGATSPTLTISQVHPQDGPGFYFCQATNSCGTRNSAFVFLDLCPGDFNCSGVITVQDIFDFLAAFFAGQPLADVNGVSGHSVQDIFDFLADYFAGCA
jgi:hypothetical protein